uniref:Isopenicillin N synthase n=1 Tax=Streptantibioticus cattleyicolor TaxID=29303 RepID=IPNS_STRCT|nr:RecName: Full=Isopenicillin N synthase; Short=IPNS [Streptantibioticus cattleyicolor]BAA11234.1 isopenicillin N synthetase [Streptantibioticus cattleyicolor]
MPVLMPSADVPTIDISPQLFGTDPTPRRTSRGRSTRPARGSGFFYASHHGIDVRRLQTWSNESTTMTDQRSTTWRSTRYNENNSHVRNGYYMARPGRETVESWCYLNPSFGEDHPMMKAGTPMHEVNVWPDEERHPDFGSFGEQYHREVSASRRCCCGASRWRRQAGESSSNEVTEEDTLSAVSMIRYPYLDPYPEAAIKTGPDGTRLSFEDHLDVSMITVLSKTEVQNLQVETVDGWQSLPTSGENFLINCGTYLGYLTNDYFPAPNHRVKYVNAERLSLPFFLHAGQNSVMKPFTRRTGDRKLNPAVTYGEYLQEGFTR